MAHNRSVPDLVQSRNHSTLARRLPSAFAALLGETVVDSRSSLHRFSVALAALLGVAFGSYFLLNDARLTVLSGALCPPALLVIPAFLEVEIRYPSVRHSWLGMGLAVGIIIVLNAILYATLMHYGNRVAAWLSRQ